MMYTRFLTVLASGLRRSLDRWELHCAQIFFSLDMAIKSQENTYIVTMVESERRVLRALSPLPAHFRSRPRLPRFVRRTALRYPNCLVGIWLAFVLLVRGLPICPVLKKKLTKFTEMKRIQQLWHVMAVRETSPQRMCHCRWWLRRQSTQIQNLNSLYFSFNLSNFCQFRSWTSFRP